MTEKIKEALSKALEARIADPYSPRLVALVAVDHWGMAVLIDAAPGDWWEGCLMGDGFEDVFDGKRPEEPGVYWWRGVFKFNANAGRAMPWGEIDDYPGEWIGEWERVEIAGEKDLDFLMVSELSAQKVASSSENKVV